MDTDLETIKHLDFDVEAKEEKATPCGGWSYMANTGAIKEHTKGCQNPIQVVATRVCCGRRGSYCLNCYNKLCNLYAEKVEEGLIHTLCGTLVRGKPFLNTLEWL